VGGRDHINHSHMSTITTKTMMEVPCAWRRNKYKKLKKKIMSTTTSQYNGDSVSVSVVSGSVSVSSGSRVERIFF